MLLQYPDLANAVEVPDLFAASSLQGLPLLYELYRTIRESPGISPSALLERWRDKSDFEIMQKLMQRKVYGTEEKTGQVKVYSDAVDSLIKKHNDTRFEVLQNKLNQGTISDSEREEYRSLLKR